jgi:hypothetical protein
VPVGADALAGEVARGVEDDLILAGAAVPDRYRPVVGVADQRLVERLLVPAYPELVPQGLAS